ncbi:toxin glutamine deamidase domain-containing protein [Dactylosporangium sp. CA-092794]|uniref:toxin glutamine deamidase domain-containing protein n=1 Tax=Dactylosporangium sp. CA-092794 TaxID=3239929 RepID=UPI003D94A68F
MRDQMAEEKLGTRNRVRVAGALLTPEDSSITTHTSVRPMRHGDGRAPTDLNVHPEAQRVLDRIKAVADSEPGVRSGQNHGRCAEVVLVSDRLYELERQWQAEGRPGEFAEYARDKLRGGVVATHWIGDNTLLEQEHGDYAPPCNSCEPFLREFGIESIDPREGFGTSEHDTGPLGPHSEAEPPSTVGQVGDGRTVAETRAGRHIDPPKEVDQAALDKAFPRDEHGRPQLHADPRTGEWAQKVNDGGPLEPGRNNNCPDVAMAYLATHYGDPTVAGSMHDPRVGGEHNGAQRIAEWTRGQWSMDGRDAAGLGRVEAALREAGPGSASVIVLKWADTGEGHSFNAVNVGGDIVWVDMQRGLISDGAPFYDHNIAGVWSITLDPHGDPLMPGSHDHLAPVHDGGLGRPEPWRAHELTDQPVQRGTMVEIDLYRGGDGKLHIPGDPHGTWRSGTGFLRDKTGYVQDWHTASRNDIVVESHEVNEHPHRLEHDPALRTDPVDGVHSASQDWHAAQDRAGDVIRQRNDLVDELNQLLGGEGDEAYRYDAFKPGKTLEQTLGRLALDPDVPPEMIDKFRQLESDLHAARNDQARASGVAGMHAGLGTARAGLLEGGYPPETVHVLGDPTSATPGEVDIIALRWNTDDPAGNRLEIWEAKGGDGRLGGRYIPELGGKAEQGTAPYLTWMLENDPNLLQLYRDHPGLIDAIKRGEVPVTYHKVTQSIFPRGEGAEPGGRPVVIDPDGSTTTVSDFLMEGTDNVFHPERLEPNWDRLDNAPPSRLGVGGPGSGPLGAVDVGDGGRVWHAHLPPGLTRPGDHQGWPAGASPGRPSPGADPHALQAHVQELLRGAADPRHWSHDGPPKIVIHAEHGIDAATARQIEHTRLDGAQPGPAPRIIVDGPRLHGDPIRLPAEIISQDQRDGVPYFDAEQQAEHTIRVVDGRLYDREGLPLHGHYIYAVDERTQTIHAIRYADAGAAKHSSLFAGGNVHAAGDLIVEHGKLTVLNNHSGHYTPVADHVSRGRDALAYHGADLSGADFRVVGHEPTDYSTARGEAAFDRAIAELGRPGEFDGVVSVRRLTEGEAMARTGESALVRVELADGRHVDVDATGVREFLQAARPEGPDTGLFPPDRATVTADTDLAFQGSDLLRDRIQAALPEAHPEDASPAAARPAGRADHVLVELDRLLAERLGDPPLHDGEGGPIPPPRHTNHAVAALRDLTDTHIHRLAETAGLTPERADRLARDLAARRDRVLERFTRPALPEEIARMTDAVRRDLRYTPRELTGRELYDLLREQTYRKTGDFSTGLTIREAARALGGSHHDLIDDYLASPEGRAHHEAVIGLDLAAAHGPRFDLIDERYREPSPERVQEHAAEHAGDWTGPQHEAVRRYTGGGEGGIDRFLRTGEAARPADRADAFRIQGAMRESTADLRLHGSIDPRRLGLTDPADLTGLAGLVGGEVTMDSFTRLGADAGHAPYLGSVTLIVEAPRGTPMAWIGAIGEHADGHVLLPAGARLHVLELGRVGYDRYELRLRYEGYDDPAALAGRLRVTGEPEWPQVLHEELLPHGAGLPMTAEQVYEAAHAAGVDLRGIEIRVVTDPEQARYMDAQGVAAILPPEDGGRVLLVGPAAFTDHDTLAATLHDTVRETPGGHDDPILGGDDVRLDRPGPADLGDDAGGSHRAGDGPGGRDGGPHPGPRDRAGEPAGPAGGLDHPAGGARDGEPGGAGRGTDRPGEPRDPVHVSREPRDRDDLGGDAGDEPGDLFRPGSIALALGAESALGQPGDHPGARGTAPVGAGDDAAARPGPAPDAAAATLEAHRAVQERIAPHSPELADVVQRLLDDPHALNVTNSLRNPALREVVLAHLEELARGDALTPYDFDLVAFLADHPGQGPLYEKVPPHINKVVMPDGTERTRLDLYVERLKAADPALRVGAHPTAHEMQQVRDYAQRLLDEVKPEVDRQLTAIADRIRATTDGPVDYNSRPKDANGLIDKVVRMSRGRPGAPPRDWYRVGDIVDAVGARITVPDTASLWRTLQAVVQHYGVGDGGRIVEVDNMYASPKSKRPEYRVIPLCIGIEVGGHQYAFELQLTTLRASVAADIEHNSLYKPYVALLSQADAEAVRRAFEEAAALDQLEDSS